MEEKEFLRVVTFKRKYINLMNSSNFFLAEIEKINSSIYGLEATNAGMGL